MDKITVWFDKEEAKERPVIYVSLEGIRGNLILTERGWKLSLFLDPLDADNLAFALNCNLQQAELIRKEKSGE